MLNPLARDVTELKSHNHITNLLVDISRALGNGGGGGRRKLIVCVDRINRCCQTNRNCLQCAAVPCGESHDPAPCQRKLTSGFRQLVVKPFESDLRQLSGTADFDREPQEVDSCFPHASRNEPRIDRQHIHVAGDMTRRGDAGLDRFCHMAQPFERRNLAARAIGEPARLAGR